MSVQLKIPFMKYSLHLMLSKGDTNMNSKVPHPAVKEIAIWGKVCPPILLCFFFLMNNVSTKERT